MKLLADLIKTFLKRAIWQRGRTNIQDVKSTSRFCGSGLDWHKLMQVSEGVGMDREQKGPRGGGENGEYGSVSTEAPWSQTA